MVHQYASTLHFYLLFADTIIYIASNAIIRDKQKKNQSTPHYGLIAVLQRSLQFGATGAGGPLLIRSQNYQANERGTKFAFVLIGRGENSEKKPEHFANLAFLRSSDRRMNNNPKKNVFCGTRKQKITQFETQIEQASKFEGEISHETHIQNKVCVDLYSVVNICPGDRLLIVNIVFV